MSKMIHNYLLCEFAKKRHPQVNQHCDNWSELFKGVQKLKKHVDAEHKKNGDAEHKKNGDDGGWVWQETEGGVKGWSLVKV